MRWARSSVLIGTASFSFTVGATIDAVAQCPVGTEITVDYDLPGSGYSETTNNWTDWPTAPCNGSTYRYLSHTVGDGSRQGTATWQPTITYDGYWEFITGYRATVNRSTDADYWAYDDQGSAVHQSVDQTQGTDCQWVNLGTFFCQIGGNCRVVLDGTDDSQSDCADVTIFRLLSCTDPPDGGAPDGGSQGRCDGIRAVPDYEVCEETATTCAGTYDDGSGCMAYCAAAGMTCTARYGGEPGCQQEPQNPIPCDEVNSHQSDWCECEGPAITPDGGVGGSGASGVGGAASGGNGGTGGGGGTGTGAGGGGAIPPNAAAPGDEGDCGCRVAGRTDGWPVAPPAALFATCWLLRSRRRGGAANGHRIIGKRAVRRDCHR